MALALRNHNLPSDWADEGAQAIYTAIEILRKQDDEAERAARKA